MRNDAGNTIETTRLTSKDGLQLTLLNLGATSPSPAGSNVSGVLPIMFLSFLIGVTCLLVYFMTKKRFFIVDYSGGGLAAECRWYSQSEIDEFQRLISIEKDRIAARE